MGSGINIAIFRSLVSISILPWTYAKSCADFTEPIKLISVSRSYGSFVSLISHFAIFLKNKRPVFFATKVFPDLSQVDLFATIKQMEANMGMGVNQGRRIRNTLGELGRDLPADETPKKLPEYRNDTIGLSVRESLYAIDQKL